MIGVKGGGVGGGWGVTLPPTCRHILQKNYCRKFNDDLKGLCNAMNMVYRSF
jgi:hypothetical protein